MRTQAFRERYGPWALVVGGTDGLGLAFAEVLAGRGLDLVLVARRRPLLAEVAAALRARHGVEIREVALDAAAPGAAAELVRTTARLDVGLLVCNAALAPVGPFLDLAADDVDRMLDLNCRLPARLAHALGARLVARGRGGIVLVGSMAGFQGAALVAHYAATKAYLRVLGEALWAELGPAGVDVVTCCAGRTRTPTFERSRREQGRALAPPVMEPGPVVRETLAALGRRPVVVPGRLNRLAALATERLLPRRTAVSLVSAATRALYPDGPTGSRRRARRGGGGA